MSAPPARLRRAVRAGAVAAVLLGLAIAAGILVHRARTGGQSDVIVEPWDRLDNRPWLKANLRNARVVVPDRPHAFSEVQASRAGARESVGRTRQFLVSTGALRLRGADPGPKAPGVLRIIALGDSVTHGWGVAEEESWPARLQAELQRRGRDAQVINAGVPANQPDTMLAWCQREAPALAPDLLLWTKRPPPQDPPPHRAYVQAAEACQRAIRAPVVAILPPISSFDPHGQQVWRQEQADGTRRWDLSPFVFANG